MFSLGENDTQTHFMLCSTFYSLDKLCDYNYARCFSSSISIFNLSWIYFHLTLYGYSRLFKIHVVAPAGRLCMLSVYSMCGIQFVMMVIQFVLLALCFIYMHTCLKKLCMATKFSIL